MKEANCNTCPFWQQHEQQPAVPAPVKSVMVEGVFSGKNGMVKEIPVKPQPAAPLLGNCLLEPPTSIMLPMQGGSVDPRQISFLQKEYYPVKPGFGLMSGCSHHPEVEAARVRRLATEAIVVWKNWLEFDPQRHSHNEGLSRIPPLSELGRIADISQRSDDDAKKD